MPKLKTLIKNFFVISVSFVSFFSSAVRATEHECLQYLGKLVGESRLVELLSIVKKHETLGADHIAKLRELETKKDDASLGLGQGKRAGQQRSEYLALSDEDALARFEATLASTNSELEKTEKFGAEINTQLLNEIQKFLSKNDKNYQAVEAYKKAFEDMGKIAQGIVDAVESGKNGSDTSELESRYTEARQIYYSKKEILGDPRLSLEADRVGDWDIQFGFTSELSFLDQLEIEDIENRSFSDNPDLLKVTAQTVIEEMESHLRELSEALKTYAHGVYLFALRSGQ